jgi:LPS-assembly lipoprotein
MRRRAVLLALLLPGCGYRPLYGSGGATDVVSELRGVSIPEQDTRVGQLIRNELLSSIRPAGTAENDRYTLSFTPDLRKETITARTETGATRSALKLTVTYRLTSIDGKTIYKEGKVFSQVSYDVLREPVADLRAETNALERAAREAAMDIRVRISAQFAGG